MTMSMYYVISSYVCKDLNVKKGYVLFCSGGNTSLASDWLKVFLKKCDIVLKIPESCGKSIHNASEVCLIKRKRCIIRDFDLTCLLVMMA